MSEKEFKPKKLSMTNTKKELLDQYAEVVERLAEKERAKLNPQKIIEQKVQKETIEKVKEFTLDSIDEKISTLNVENVKLLNDLQQKLHTEVSKYEDIQSAIVVKEKELKEIFEIEKSAHTLAALIESQSAIKDDFEKEMSQKKLLLNNEIETTKTVWEKEKAEYEKERAELKREEEKKNKREKEEYEYNFKREKLIAKNKLDDELKATEIDRLEKLNETEKELELREKEVSEKENEIALYKEKIDEFDKAIKTAVDNAVKEAIEKVELENKNKIELISKEHEGKENVSGTTIKNLEKIVLEQQKKIEELSSKLDTAYQKVQDVAIKAIDGAANSKSFTDLQNILSDKVNKKSNE